MLTEDPTGERLVTRLVDTEGLRAAIGDHGKWNNSGEMRSRQAAAEGSRELRASALLG